MRLQHGRWPPLPNCLPMAESILAPARVRTGRRHRATHAPAIRPNPYRAAIKNSHHGSRFLTCEFQHRLVFVRYADDKDPLDIPAKKLAHAHLQPQRMAFLARLQSHSRLQCGPKAIAAGRILCGQIPRHPAKPTTQLTRHDNLCSPANPPCAGANRHWTTCLLALQRRCLRTH